MISTQVLYPAPQTTLFPALSGQFHQGISSAHHCAAVLYLIKQDQLINLVWTEIVQQDSRFCVAAARYPEPALRVNLRGDNIPEGVMVYSALQLRVH